MRKKGLIAVGLLVLLACMLAGAALWYVKPGEQLDLGYKEVVLGDRFISMAKNLQTAFVLTEADVNNIGKAYIAANPQHGPDVTITGARFQLEGERIAAHYNLQVKHRIPVGIAVYYRIKWSQPNLIAVVDEAQLKGISLPNRYFDDIVIPLGGMVPKPLHIQSAALTGNKLVIQFQKPTFAELAELLKRKLGF